MPLISMDPPIFPYICNTPLTLPLLSSFSSFPFHSSLFIKSLPHRFFSRLVSLQFFVVRLCTLCYLSHDYVFFLFFQLFAFFLEIMLQSRGGHFPLYFVTTCINRVFVWGLFQRGFTLLSSWTPRAIKKFYFLHKTSPKWVTLSLKKIWVDIHGMHDIVKIGNQMWCFVFFIKHTVFT